MFSEYDRPCPADYPRLTSRPGHDWIHAEPVKPLRIALKQSCALPIFTEHSPALRTPQGEASCWGRTFQRRVGAVAGCLCGRLPVCAGGAYAVQERRCIRRIGVVSKCKSWRTGSHECFTHKPGTIPVQRNSLTKGLNVEHTITGHVLFVYFCLVCVQP